MKDVALHAATNAPGNLPSPSAMDVTGMAQKAGAAMAASRQALADNASKALASTTALMGASLKNSAWPVAAGAAAAGVPKGVKKSARQGRGTCACQQKTGCAKPCCRQKSSPSAGSPSARQGCRT